MKKKVKKNSYLECKETFLENKNYFLFSLATFCFFVVIGFGLPIFFREQIIQLLMNLINIFEGRSMFEVITMIFLNNAKAALLSILLGVFFGIFPVAVLIVNGYLVGFTGRIASEEFGLSIMLRLIPHGIFELPAILISVGLGLKMGMVLLKERKEFKKEFKKAIKFYLLVILPLLLIASIVEGILVFLE